MTPFCKLANPQSYVSCDWDLITAHEDRVWWVEFFKKHFVTIVGLAVDAAIRRGEDPATARVRADACRDDFWAHCDAFLSDPEKFAPVNILTLDAWRDGRLRAHGFPDAFVDVKDRENEKMLPLLPVVTKQLDALRGREQAEAVIEGVFAGNIFDLGSDATAGSFMNDSPDFFSVLSKLKPRPWLIDDLDSLVDRLIDGPPHRKMVFFIDNAGSDFILGALSMMRWMARRGTEVILAANEWPTLNDMTIHDVRHWWLRILEAEPSLADLPIQPVSTGTAEPLIDLLKVSDDLNSACADADFVVLEGMGRSIESNLDARFACDSLNIGMIKMGIVARRMRGEVYDLVCRFRPATVC